MGEALKLSDSILADYQLKSLVAGTDQRRYYLVNPAAKADELVRMWRRLYVVADEFREFPVHPFAVMDCVCLRKVDWQGLGWIEQGLRVEADALNQITGTELPSCDGRAPQVGAQIGVPQQERCPHEETEINAEERMTE